MKQNQQRNDWGDGTLMGFENWWPKMGQGCFVAAGVKVIGRVEMEDEVNLWFNTVVRGDVAPIFIGEKTNIQDLCMLHVTEDFSLYIGKFVSVGHHVTLHGAHVEDSCLIGMGAVLLDGVEVGKNSLVAAGSLLPPGKKYPPESLIKGSPAKVERLLTGAEKEMVGHHYLSYLQYKDQYLKGFKKEVKKGS